jgi:cytochrome P450
VSTSWSGGTRSFRCSGIRPGSPAGRTWTECARSPTRRWLSCRLNLEPPEHTEFRDFISGYFSPARLREIEPEITALAGRLIRTVLDSGEADLLADFAYPLPMTVICDLIGLPEDDRPMVKAWNNAWLGLQTVPLPPEQQLQCVQAVLAYEQYTRDLLAERGRNPKDDLLTRFAVEADSENPVCTVDDAVVAVRLLIATGHETTTNLIGNALHHLLVERERWQALVDDPGLAAAVVEETLRFDPPVQATPRFVTEDVELAGVTIPAGSRTLTVLSAVGHDPSWVDDPDTFRLDRTGPSRHLGFGSGVHFCIGAQLARLEARVALVTLATVVPDLRLADDYEPQHLPGGFVFRGLSQLPGRWPLPEPVDAPLPVG